VKNLGGPGNLVSSEGAEWKKWRMAFNPGFSANHLMSLVPVIVDECHIFIDILKKYAEKEEIFRMERVTTRLTVDVIGKVVLDHPFDSQKRPNELVDTFMRQVKWQRIGAQFNPIELINGPIRIPMQQYLSWKMDRYIGKVLDERFATREQRGKSKAVVDLALEAYLKEVKGTSGDISKVKTLDPEFRKAAINNMKIFVFAGHDTTSSTICYAYYYLTKYPETLAKIRKEHDEVFGPDPSTVAEQLKRDPRLLNKLEYTLAVTREVLRIQPPASTVRIGQKGCVSTKPATDLDSQLTCQTSFFVHDPETGEPLPTEHLMLWPVDVGLHRSEKYWPEPHVFRPERHLPKKGAGVDESANYTSNPAWVGFSKGIRNCIGQELAIIETKVILAMTLRTFDFEAAYGEVEKLKGDGSGYPSETDGIQEQFGEIAYQVQLGTAKPREGMPCRIRLRT
jgi:cytochrome P450